MPITPQNLADETRRIAGAIRDVMSVDDDLELTEVEQLHETLVGCVDATNKRLRHCDQLLRKGLRQEALQECEREPALLDLVAELDLPEWDAWADYARQHGLPPQPPLLLDVAADLNAAYVKVQSLSNLMRQYRLLALARSPLTRRLAVLRTIAERDAGNPIWTEDVRLFEAARMREMTAGLAPLLAGDDLSAITSLKRELEGAPWQTPISPGLHERIDEAFRQLTAKRARARLAALASEIDAAFSQFDREAAHRGRTEWDSLIEPAELHPDDELSLHVQSAFQWLDDVEAEEGRQAGFLTATAKLDSLLDDEKASEAQLHRAYSAAERFDEAIPTRLVRRYEERLRSIDLAGRRRMRLIVTSAVVAVLLCGGATLWGVSWQLRSRETERVAATLATYLEQGQTAEANLFYEKSVKESPHIVATPAVAKLHADLETQLQKDADRRQRLENLLSRGSELATQQTWDAVEKARTDLQTAKSLAKNDAEQARVAAVRQQVESTTAALQAEVDGRFHDEVSVLVKQMAKLDGMALNEVQALTQKARGIAARLRVSPDALELSRIGSLVRSIEDRSEYLGRRQAVVQSLAAIEKSIGRASEYSIAFKVYKQAESPGDSSAEVEKSLDDALECLPTVEAWNDLAAQWNRASIIEASAEPAALELIATLEKKYDGYPGVAAVAALKPYVESVAKRHGADGDPILDNLANILKKPIFAMYSMERTSGEIIYLVNEPTVGADGRLSFRSLKSPGGSELSPVALLRTGDLMPREGGAFFGPSPQGRFAQQAIESLANRDGRSFEFVICKLLTQLYKEPKMDPILRCYLLQTFHEIAAPGSTVLRDGLAEFETAISSEADLSDQNWVSQDDEVIKLRGTIRAQLESMAAVGRTPQEAYVKQIAPQVKQMVEATPQLSQARWVGALFPNVDGRLSCLCRPDLVAGFTGPLWIYDQQFKPSSPWREVARVENGVVQSAVSSSTATDGSLVFAFISPPPKTTDN